MHSVLVVDDEILMREVLVRHLRAAGYRTTDAPDATTALELVAAGDPDVVLVDVQMPGGRDGLWLVDRLREQSPKTAIVLATATERVSPAVSMQDGVVEYLVKPFERDRMIAAVQRAVEWRQGALSRGTNRAAAGQELDEWLRGKRPPTKGQD